MFTFLTALARKLLIIVILPYYTEIFVFVLACGKEEMIDNSCPKQVTERAGNDTDDRLRCKRKEPRYANQECKRAKKEYRIDIHREPYALIVTVLYSGEGRFTVCKFRLDRLIVVAVDCIHKYEPKQEYESGTKRNFINACRNERETDPRYDEVACVCIYANDTKLTHVTTI